jgi:hypothetical protein
MDAHEPRLRHRGFFLHSSDEPDSGEHENPEGFVVRTRPPRQQTRRRNATRRHGSSGVRFGGRSHRHDSLPADGQTEIRSASATGSRQPAHLPR